MGEEAGEVEAAGVRVRARAPGRGRRLKRRPQQHWLQRPRRPMLRPQLLPRPRCLLLLNSSQAAISRAHRQLTNDGTNLIDSPHTDLQGLLSATGGYLLMSLIDASRNPHGMCTPAPDAALEAAAAAALLPPPVKADKHGCVQHVASGTRIRDVDVS